MLNNSLFGNCGNAEKQSLVKRFSKDEDGGFAIIFGLSVSVLFLSAGMAFDYSRISHTKSLMDNALDSAILSAGHEMSKGVTSESDIRNTFDAFLAANLTNRSLAPADYEIKNFSVDFATGEIKAEINADVEMGIMSIAGYDKVTVGSVSEAVFNASKVEVTMMLDVTGSMGADGKLESMKLAATDAVDILLQNGASTSTRVGLVPYAASVNAGLYASTVTEGASSRCVTERSSDTYNDTYYTITPIGADDRAECPDNEIVPLSTNAGDLKNKINAYYADGTTAGHLGISWSYYMLSQKWKDLWSDAEPANYGKAQKIAILMTDGKFNTYYDGESQVYNEDSPMSSDAAKSICEDMKKSKGGKPGITIYSITFYSDSFKEKDDKAKTLKSCASPDTDGTQHYFSASNGEELRQAFASIANNIQKLRLSR